MPREASSFQPRLVRDVFYYPVRCEQYQPSAVNLYIYSCAELCLVGTDVGDIAG